MEPNATAVDQMLRVGRDLFPTADRNALDGWARSWWGDEDRGTYDIGCPDQSARPALMYAVQAARHICAVDYGEAERLLLRALAELRARA